MANRNYCDTQSLEKSVKFLFGKIDIAQEEVSEATFETFANTGDGDYIVVYDVNGQAWAIAADKTGSSPEPTGAVWDAIAAGNKAQVDISGDTTAAEVAASFELAFDALTGFTSVITTDDSAADGTMTFTAIGSADTIDAATYDEDDGTSGSISVAVVDGEVQTISGEGFSSLAQNAAGDYTITLDDAYHTLLSASFIHESATAEDLNFQIRSYDLGADSKTIRFYSLTGATPTEPANGDLIYIRLALRNSDVYL